MAAPPSQQDWRLAHSKWRPGAVVGNRYRLEKIIGFGATAEVWSAEHVLLESTAAVKLLADSHQDQRAELVGRFLREARAAAQLRSRHVVRILDLGLTQDCAYMAMELLEGETLAERLHRVGKLEPIDTARILSQLACGLEVAHDAGIVHRDLKPSNIFLARDRGHEVVKIVDFGIAKRTYYEGVDQLATQHGALVGTPSYASPEQILSTGGIDARSDLWQVAVVAFECLSGQRPFDAPSIGQLMLAIVSGPPPVPSAVARVPAGFDDWFARGTAREPADRFRSARELSEALCAVLSPGTTAAEHLAALPAWVPPPADSLPDSDATPTLPVDDPAETVTPQRVEPAPDSFEFPDLRPRRRRPALLLALVVAVIVIALWVRARVASSPPDEATAGDRASGSGAAGPEGLRLPPARRPSEAVAADAGPDAQGVPSATGSGPERPRWRPGARSAWPPAKNDGRRRAEDELGI